MQSLRAFSKFVRMFVWVLYAYWLSRRVFHKLQPQAYALAVEKWAQGMLSILGVTVRVHGMPSKGPVLMAANHISWLDIVVMLATSHCRFIAKSEIRNWPVLGTVTAGGGSFFIERTSHRDAMRVVRQMADALVQGQLLAVFPEGSTGDGKTLLPFHGNLLQAAIVSDAPIQPIGLQYLEVQSGEKSFAPCYQANDTLLGSVWRTLCAPPLLAVVHYGANQMSQGRNRRAWAVDLRDSISKLID